jgi:23S rRNA pseudouridine1911/1915/1917 synthase
VADTLYGGRLAGGATRQMLHARALHFDDPGGGGDVAWTAEMPADMTAVMQQITWEPAA